MHCHKAGAGCVGGVLTSMPLRDSAELVLPVETRGVFETLRKERGQSSYFLLSQMAISNDPLLRKNSAREETRSRGTIDYDRRLRILSF